MSSTLSSTVCLALQHLHAILREVTDLHVVPEFARAALHRQDAGEQLQQRRFAGAVRADQHGALAALRLEFSRSYTTNWP